MKQKLESATATLKAREAELTAARGAKTAALRALSSFETKFVDSKTVIAEVEGAPHAWAAQSCPTRLPTHRRITIPAPLLAADEVKSMKEGSVGLEQEVRKLKDRVAKAKAQLDAVRTRA